MKWRAVRLHGQRFYRIGQRSPDGMKGDRGKGKKHGQTGYDQIRTDAWLDMIGERTKPLMRGQLTILGRKF